MSQLNRLHSSACKRHDTACNALRIMPVRSESAMIASVSLPECTSDIAAFGAFGHHRDHHELRNQWSPRRGRGRCLLAIPIPAIFGSELELQPVRYSRHVRRRYNSRAREPRAASGRALFTPLKPLPRRRPTNTARQPRQRQATLSQKQGIRWDHRLENNHDRRIAPMPLRARNFRPLRRRL
jgi:hypothetical protein